MMVLYNVTCYQSSSKYIYFEEITVLKILVRADALRLNSQGYLFFKTPVDELHISMLLFHTKDSITQKKGSDKPFCLVFQPQESQNLFLVANFFQFWLVGLLPIHGQLCHDLSWLVVEDIDAIAELDGLVNTVGNENSG